MQKQKLNFHPDKYVIEIGKKKKVKNQLNIPNTELCIRLALLKNEINYLQRNKNDSVSITKVLTKK